MTIPILDHPVRNRGWSVLLIAAWLPMVAACIERAQLVAAADANTAPSGGEMSVADEPYLVFVLDEAAHLRCGPSGEDYRTDALRHGQELEVYVEAADGWLGVRPAESSFCWVPADAVRLLDSSRSKTTDAIEAEVTENKTVAWIGTNLGRARRYRWQVQLGEGETVTILGRSERDGPDGPQMWYRIVPPSGEFRWIHRDQVVTNAEDLIAAVQSKVAEADIEFLPAGPSAAAENRKSDTPLRRVSDDRPYREAARSEIRAEVADESPGDRARALAEIRRLDEIEKHIDARQRSRFDRVPQAEIASDPAVNTIAHADENVHADHGSDGHPMRSFSQRVTEGLSSLIGGRGPQSGDLEPSTQSSRRVQDLVPIGSGLAATNTPSGELPGGRLAPQPQAQPIEINALAVAPHAEAAVTAPANATMPMVSAAVPLANAERAAKTVAATAHPEFRSNESQIAITSAPRLVTATGTSLASNDYANNASLNPVLPPAKLRTITAAQIEEVQRSVASSTAESLPMLMSKLMARGASAPEIRLVGDAAQRFSMNDLTQRARDYEALARRRDGDTVVATTTLTTPTVTGNTMVAGTTSAAAGGSFVPRIVGQPVATMSSHPSTIVPVAHTQHMPVPGTAGGQPAGLVVPPATGVTESGVLVAVYSADPSRPPYAITDRAGRTLAYVTPAPGVELKKHLGSEISVQGESGYLQGLDTPHVLATQAQRLLR